VAARPDCAPPAVTREAIEALFERLVAQSSRHYGGTDRDLPAIRTGLQPC
jgi:hypothetical protein